MTNPSKTTVDVVRAPLTNIVDESGRAMRNLRALATSLKALLPADPATHPVLKLPPGEPFRLDDPRFELRDALTAARQLAEMVDYLACGLTEIDEQVSAVRSALGIKRGEA